jgi:tetratricopeptide (TPR) repeat protein
MYAQTLKLVADLPKRRPTIALPSKLEELFQRLGAAQCNAEALEDQIWHLWMHYPHGSAARILDKACSDIAAHRYDIAETRLERLLRACPDYAEAWNKRATLYYLQQRDAESVRDIHRTLELEPRHFGALCGLGEILLSEGEFEDALFVFYAALRLNPHLEGARTAVGHILAGDADPLH